MGTVSETIAEVVARTPEWLRRDLHSDDRTVRTAAEETLVAMIANALAKSDSK
jgi:hypothetical protein